MTDAPRLSPLWLFALPLAILLLHAFYYYPYMVDDAFISLRYADRFIHGHGLTWNDGERVEGYSNLLWVLLTSGLGWLGFDLVAAARAVCLLSAIAGLPALLYYQQRWIPGKPITALLGMLAYALSAPIAIWGIGGLETTLTMALLAWAYALSAELLQAPSKKTAAITGILLGLVCLTRPEGAFFTITIAAALLLLNRKQLRPFLPSLVILCAIPFAFFASQLAFRLSYYGEWMPNTYYAKVAYSPSRVINGMLYCIKALASFLPLLLAIFLGLDKLRKPEYAARRRATGFFALICTAWVVILAITGGDIFAGYRHILPAIPLLILMLMEALAIAYDTGPPRKTHIFAFYLIACFFWLQCIFDENQNAKDEHWEWQCKELGEWLARHYGDTQPLVAASNTGAIPYYSHLPSLDMYGINDAWLTHHRSAIFGQGFMGHELFNSDYVLSRKPDIIIFFIGIDQQLYGSDLQQKPEFKALYHPQTIALPDYDAVIYLRNDSTKLGQ